VNGAGGGADGVAVPLGRVSILGAGQVGTMLGMALRASGSRDLKMVTLYDRDAAVAEASLGRGAGDSLVGSVDRALDADTIVLALPVPEIVKLLDEFGPQVRPPAVVIDTGSAKVAVVNAMRRGLAVEVHAIGGHPMAGTERPGPDGADAELLRGAPFALTPIRDDPAALWAGRALATAVGAHPLVVAADIHDRTVAVTSHLPHLLAFALASVAGHAAASASFEPALASTGYLGATRLAGSDPSMVAGFLWANASGVTAAVASLRGEMDRLVMALNEGPGSLAMVLTGARDLAKAVGMNPEAVGTT
jgi:prephenate dehydrogenase